MRFVFDPSDILRTNPLKSSGKIWINQIERDPENKENVEFFLRLCLG